MTEDSAGRAAEDSRPHVAVGILSTDTVHASWAVALARLTARVTADRTAMVALIDGRTSLIPRGRHDVACAALSGGASHLLFTDTDMRFPDDALARLLAHGKPIVGVAYRKRRPPYDLTTELEDGKQPELPADGLLEVARIGCGLLLIETRVFCALDQPYFRLGCHDLEGGRKEWVGEDWDFCDRARAAGFSVWCDPKLSREVKHIGQCEVSI